MDDYDYTLEVAGLQTNERMGGQGTQRMGGAGAPQTAQASSPEDRRRAKAKGSTSYAMQFHPLPHLGMPFPALGTSPLPAAVGVQVQNPLGFATAPLRSKSKAKGHRPSAGSNAGKHQIRKETTVDTVEPPLPLPLPPPPKKTKETKDEEVVPLTKAEDTANRRWAVSNYYRAPKKEVDSELYPYARVEHFGQYTTIGAIPKGKEDSRRGQVIELTCGQDNVDSTLGRNVVFEMNAFDLLRSDTEQIYERFKNLPQTILREDEGSVEGLTMTAMVQGIPQEWTTLMVYKILGILDRNLVGFRRIRDSSFNPTHRGFVTFSNDRTLTAGLTAQHIVVLLLCRKMAFKSALKTDCTNTVKLCKEVEELNTGCLKGLGILVDIPIVDRIVRELETVLATTSPVGTGGGEKQVPLAKLIIERCNKIFNDFQICIQLSLMPLFNQQPTQADAGEIEFKGVNVFNVDEELYKYFQVTTDDSFEIVAPFEERVESTADHADNGLVSFSEKDDWNLISDNYVMAVSGATTAGVPTPSSSTEDVSIQEQMKHNVNKKIVLPTPRDSTGTQEDNSQGQINTLEVNRNLITDDYMYKLKKITEIRNFRMAHISKDKMRCKSFMSEKIGLLKRCSDIYQDVHERFNPSKLTKKLNNEFTFFQAPNISKVSTNDSIAIKASKLENETALHEMWVSNVNSPNIN